MRKANHRLSYRETTSSSLFWNGKACFLQWQCLQLMYFGMVGKRIDCGVKMGFWHCWHFWNATSLNARTLVLYQGKVIEHWRALLSWCIILKRNWGLCGGGEENHGKWGLSGRRGFFNQKAKYKSITINYCPVTWWGVSDGTGNKENHNLYSVSSKLHLKVTLFHYRKNVLKVKVM